MTATTSSTSTDHLIQICRERSARGVATRADWQRLAELNPDRARRELITFLQLNQQHTAPNPYETKERPHIGLVGGFLIGVVFMVGYWLFGDWLQREVITTSRQWDVVTFTQYVAASLLPFFAVLGWRYDENRKAKGGTSEPEVQRFSAASWGELLTIFDQTRKAGGTRMY